MRAAVLSFLFILAIALPASAATGNRPLSDFYGVYLGHGTEEALGEITPPVEDPTEKQTRFSQVTIRPAPEEKGFSIEWSTLKLKGDEIPREADTKTYVQTFRATDKPNIYRDITSGDLNLGADSSWAVITGGTLSIVQVSVEPDGSYFVSHYDRTLTEKGMDVHFTRFENSRIVRAVRLNLLRGPAKVN